MTLNGLRLTQTEARATFILHLQKRINRKIRHLKFYTNQETSCISAHSTHRDMIYLPCIRNHSHLTTTTWTFYIIRNGLHGSQCYCWHLMTRTKLCIAVVVNGIHFYWYKSCRQVQTLPYVVFLWSFPQISCSVVEGTKVCYQNFIASYSKNTNFHQIYFWYKKQEWVDQYHSQPSAHIFILQ